MRMPRPPRVLREHAAFRTLWLARAISFIGDGVALVALVLLASSRGPGVLGLVLVVDALPQLLFGPLTGALADRFEQRRLMIICNLGQAAGFGVLSVIRPSLPVLLIVVVVTSALAALFSPAGKSSIPQLVPAPDLPVANALMSTAVNLQILAGPALGGLLAGLGGARTAFAVDAVSFLVGAALLTRLPPLRVAEAGEVTGVWASTVEGLRYMARTPLPRALGLGTLVFVAFAAIDNVALVFLIRGPLHGSQAEYGFTVAAFGVGYGLASVALVRLAGRRSPQLLLLTGVLLGAAGAAGTGLAPIAGVAMLAQAFGGMGNTLDVVATDTLVQQLVPPALRGRVFGSMGTAIQAGSALAYAVAAPLVTLTGPRVAFLVSAGGMMIGLAALTPALRHRTPAQ